MMEQLTKDTKNEQHETNAKAVEHLQEQQAKRRRYKDTKPGTNLYINKLETHRCNPNQTDKHATTNKALI